VHPARDLAICACGQPASVSSRTHSCSAASRFFAVAASDDVYSCSWLARHASTFKPTVDRHAPGCARAGTGDRISTALPMVCAVAPLTPDAHEDRNSGLSPPEVSPHRHVIVYGVIPRQHHFAMGASAGWVTSVCCDCSRGGRWRRCFFQQRECVMVSSRCRHDRLCAAVQTLPPTPRSLGTRTRYGRGYPRVVQLLQEHRKTQRSVPGALRVVTIRGIADVDVPVPLITF